MSDADADAPPERSDSGGLVPLQTGPVPGAQVTPSDPRDDVPQHDVPQDCVPLPRPEVDPPQESMFGPYRLEGLIGRGGMGEIYRAYDTAHGRVVALKRLPAALAADPVFQARFRSEAALAARLHEPRVIPIHDFGEIDGQLYIDMRLVEGPDLATVLQDGPLPPHRVVDIITQVASALDAAHAAGLVHRDIKPANILVTGPESGTSGGDFVYVADFGIARAVDGSTSASLTSTGNMVGSLDYIAPERFDRDPGDRRVDIYALGCVLFQTLTGRRPFPVEGLPAIINAHLNTPPPAASAVRPNLPASLDAVIARAMAKDPDDRYPTAAALAVDARRALDGETGTVAPSPADVTAPSGKRPHTLGPWLTNAADPSPVTGPVAPTPRQPPAPAPATPAVVAMPDTGEPSRRWLVLGAALTAVLALVVAVSWSVSGSGATATVGAPAITWAPLTPTTAPAPPSTAPSLAVVPSGVAPAGPRPGSPDRRASGPSGDQGSSPPPCTVHIAIGGLSSITVGVFWSATLAADGCRAPYTWSVIGGTLPVGISLGPDGTLAGTATVPGTSAIAVEATSADGVTATRHFTLTVHGGIVGGIVGDVNGDGSVDCDDLAIVKSHYGQSGTPVKGDINGDNTVNITDISILLSHWTGGSSACNTDQPLAN